MRFFVLLLAVVFSMQARAGTRVNFFGMQAMISVTPPGGGGPDEDAMTLYRGMNVPIQDSILGPGKGLVIGNKLLNLACAKRSTGFECSIMLQRSSQTTIDSSRGYIKFVSTGVEADAVWEKFNLTAGVFKFMSADQKLSISAEPGRFVLEYQQ